MAQQHGSQCRVYLGGRNASGDIATITPAASADTHDVTNMASGGWLEFDPGLCKWELALEAFYDAAVGGIGRQFEGVGGSLIASIFDGDADVIGDTGQVYPAAVIETRETPISVADMVKLNATLRGDSRPGLNAKLLHPLGQETIAGNGASLNNLANSLVGGRANLHVTAVTGTWTIKVQHSTNDADWVDLITFTVVAAAGGATAESKTVTGTINQYTRWSAAEDVAGSITFVVGLARY